MWRHYIYIHFRKSDGVPFYVGKGTSKSKSKNTYVRARAFHSANLHWKHTVEKHGLVINVIMSCLTDEEAQKQAISEFHKGKKRSPEHIASAIKGRAGYSHSTETIAKITISNSMPDKWPHPDKSACKCRDCKDKRNFADRLRKYNHEGKYSL